MRPGTVGFFLLLACGLALAGGHKPAPPLPDRFTIGRDTFFDFGPPFHYVELLLVGPASEGTTIERVMLTPPGQACLVPAKVEVASATLKQSVASLFAGTNPCTIPEKDLDKELKRRKHELVFSGANVSMQVQCGTQTRVIRSDILERDLFDPRADTPQHTSWTMRILSQLDQAIGPGAMDKPMFVLPDDAGAPPQRPDSASLQDIASGKYDALFPGTTEKPSKIYGLAQQTIPQPTVRLVSSSPFQPTLSPLRAYPAIARAAQIEGIVTFTVDVDPNGRAINFAGEKGSPFLQKPLEIAVNRWVFPKAAIGQRVEAAVEFVLNCHSRPN